MTIMKLVAATAVTLLLSACGSSGGSSTPNTDSTGKPNPHLSSLSFVPQEHQAIVKNRKGFAPYEDTDLEITNLMIDGERLKVTDPIDFSALKEGFSEKPVRLDYKDPELGPQTGKAEAVMKIYQQPYSIVIGTLITKDTLEPKFNGVMSVDHIRGMATEIDALPTEGTFAYNGAAFSGHDKGTLNYSVDFKNRLGKGEITGLNQFGKITLHEAAITRSVDEDMAKIGINGKMSASQRPKDSGAYELGFFGPKAEEIAGDAWFDDRYLSDIGFAGKR